MAEKLAPSGLPRIRACLFDMDGLLIDSEDIYTHCTNQILHKYGRPDLPWPIKAKLQGRPGPAASQILQDWAQLPITLDDFIAQTRALQEQEFKRTQPLPGVEQLLRRLRASASEVQLAVATSSHRSNYDIKTAHLQHLFSTFDTQQVVVGDDPRIPKGRGKPLPDIYLLALEIVNDRLAASATGEKQQQPIRPEECLVFEDSVPGVEAGRRAGMQVAWVPHVGLLDVYRQRVDEVLAGRTGEHVDDEATVQRQAAASAAAASADIESRDASKSFARVPGATGEVGDGWARMFSSLQDFPLEYYGIA